MNTTMKLPGKRHTHKERNLRDGRIDRENDRGSKRKKELERKRIRKELYMEGCIIWKVPGIRKGKRQPALLDLATSSITSIPARVTFDL